ncbi:M20 metallopeptidase family protein [[Enterobacter] lignolyticus]|uniref:Amidohydrolase n=1 Tax=Enterobacter lignolyticus (strain SCF1) TaxID=701347 RepID=E3GD81_ENTLS|nr:amidohydrolase [[Enterobacter] lignolyticus]ADO50186.1 amidohydrolase [[Enterobacter] lignolyticus SCF1]
MQDHLIAQQVIQWRRALHQRAELSHQEYQTTAYLITELQAFPALTLYQPSPTGVIARLQGSLPGPVIGLRADIDALPLQEQSDSLFKAYQYNTMHACGHDAHSAMLMGTIKALCERQESLAGEVWFIFQCGEEMSPGGAKALVESGLLDNVSCFFALHVQPDLPCGKITIKPGIATANRDTFHMTIQGQGGHSAMPHQCHDPLVASAAIVSQIQSIVSREVDPREMAVISVCSLKSGDGTTARLPDSATLCGTVRSYTTEVRETVKAALRRVCQMTAQSWHCQGDIHFDAWDYSAIINDETLSRQALDAAATIFGQDNTIQATQAMCVGEDFSEYRAIAPICFAWLGVGYPDRHNYPLHHACFDPDEQAFIFGVRYYLAIIEKMTATRTPPHHH